ncbi:MFS transporter [Mycetocola sp. 2940]|uniref:MFS transporter n=1 Tax=Mycetocola sp. 2940 TaxID=3156452 RepID=UPI0033926C54
MSTSTDLPSLAKRDTNKRRLVLITIVFVNFVVWMDSGKFGLLTPFWSADLGFDTAQIGQISSAYLLGYFPMLFIAGILADRFGPKPLLITCVAGVTVLGVSMVFVTNYSELWWRNLIFGVFFGLLWAPCQRMLAVWFPNIDIPRVTAFWVGAMMLTGLVEPVVALPMADAFGWRVTFIVISILGIPAMLMLIWLTSSNPATKKGISETELAYIRSDRPASVKSVPFREILAAFKNRTVILLVIAGALATTPTWLTATWASYGALTVGEADPLMAAWVIPLLAIPGIVYAFMHGRVVNTVFKGRLKPPMLIGVLLPAFGFFAAALIPGLPWWAWLFLASTLGFFTNPLVWGSLNPFFVRVARPEVVGTLNGIAAGLQVAGGYILVSLSGGWINPELEGFRQLSLMLIIGGVVFLIAAIPLLFINEKKVAPIRQVTEDAGEPVVISPVGH